jgi:RsiW-degrading membrane proteinase PrsW (M82 family)
MSDALSLFIKQYPILFAAVFGIIPAIVWLWFWLKEDIHPEPTKLIIYCFLGGMLSVFVALPVQQWVEGILHNQDVLFIIWAFIEETLILAAAWIGGIHTASDDEAIDPVIYMIVASLGFVAMENTLFLIDPLISGNLASTLMTGDLRFIGATLLHVVCSASIGVFLAFSFKKSMLTKVLYGIGGVILATLLHALFNISIIDSSPIQVFEVFGCIWLALCVLMVSLEKIKSIPVDET